MKKFISRIFFELYFLFLTFPLMFFLKEKLSTILIVVVVRFESHLGHIFFVKLLQFLGKSVSQLEHFIVKSTSLSILYA